MGQQCQDCPGAVKPAVFPQPGKLKGQQEQEEQLAKLCGLEIEMSAWQGDPALVACPVVIAKGDEQEQQAKIARRQQPPGPLDQRPQINLPQEQAERDANPQGRGLLPDQAMEGFVVAGGAVDECQTQQRRREAQEKQ